MSAIQPPEIVDELAYDAFEIITVMKQVGRSPYILYVEFVLASLGQKADLTTFCIQSTVLEHVIHGIRPYS